jgi:basic membrane protein A
MSGYTSFYLGAKYMCPSVTMDVQFTGSWYDELEEKNAANALMDKNCVLISQHADSMGAPSVCEEKGVPNVSYNGSTEASCPNTFIISSKIDWTPYIKLICESTMNNEKIPVDYTGTISTGSVALTDLGAKAPVAGTAATLEQVKTELLNGTRHVFDTDTFTVGGQKLTTYMADVDDFGDYAGDTEVIADGFFHESEKRSAPYFDLRIDGITLLNEKF